LTKRKFLLKIKNKGLLKSQESFHRSRVAIFEGGGNPLYKKKGKALIL